MCCLLAVLVFLGPRAALAFWWLVDTARFNRTFDNFLLPLLGFLFLPFTTLVWVLVWNPRTGVGGIEWLFVLLALLIDLSSYGGSAYSNRSRISGRAA
ncbi:MAG: hypothetical protein KatS3mg060_1609 [Dehalococcoidia bacterium]|nr:MAG: hypothetical protein KatS3mg060_1609 [Dehalococcoidia bacterium]